MDQTKREELAAEIIQQSLSRRLGRILNQPENWTYAIFWQSSDCGPSQSILDWGDGSYKGEDKEKQLTKRKPTSAAEQAHRRKVIRELNSLISELNSHSCDAIDAIDEEVTDTKWFFLVSMTQSFVNGSSLPGQAFFSSAPVWVTGAERLTNSLCERAGQAQSFGLQTMVCIPVTTGVVTGVVELGSTELISHSPSLMDDARKLFNFNRHREPNLKNADVVAIYLLYFPLRGGGSPEPSSSRFRMPRRSVNRAKTILANTGKGQKVVLVSSRPKEEIPEEEAVCKRCFHVVLDQGDILMTECSCKIALLHQGCAPTFSAPTGSNNCDVCEEEVKYLPVTLLRRPC